MYVEFPFDVVSLFRIIPLIKNLMHQLLFNLGLLFTKITFVL